MNEKTNNMRTGTTAHEPIAEDDDYVFVSYEDYASIEQDFYSKGDFRFPRLGKTYVKVKSLGDVPHAREWFETKHREIHY